MRSIRETLGGLSGSIREVISLPTTVIETIKIWAEIEPLFNDCEYTGRKRTLIAVDGKIVGDIDAACRNNQIPFEKGFSQDENRVWKTGSIDNGKGGFYSFFIGEGHPGEGAAWLTNVSVFAFGNDKKFTREQLDKLMRSIPIERMPMSYNRHGKVLEELRFMEREITKREEP